MRSLVIPLLLVLACRHPDATIGRTSDAPVLFPSGATFDERWSYLETDGENSFRWMGAQASVRLAPAARWSSMRLFVHLVVPLHLLGRAPVIRVTLDGVELDRFEATRSDQLRSFILPAASIVSPSEPVLVFETSETAIAGGRVLGLALQRGAWDPVGGGE